MQGIPTDSSNLLFTTGSASNISTSSSYQPGQQFYNLRRQTGRSEVFSSIPNPMNQEIAELVEQVRNLTTVVAHLTHNSSHPASSTYPAPQSIAAPVCTLPNQGPFGQEHLTTLKELISQEKNRIKYARMRKKFTKKLVVERE
jgi:hypothetical protein